MADGYVKIDTKLDSSGLSTGLSKLGGIAAAGIAAVSTAIVGLGTSIINVGKDYEAQMSRVQAISGATAEELVKLDDVAKELGASTVFSATDAAAGMENLASAGFSVNEIMGAMPGLLDLAAVSGGDVAAASDVAASTLRAFGLEAEQAGHVADVFAQAAASTNAEVNDMGFAMKYIAPVAHSMGISIEETAAAVGILSDAGIKGTQAGTTLRGALTRLAKPTDKMVDVMDELGLAFYDSEGNMLSLQDQVAMLQDKLSGLTDEEKQNALVTLYGTNSLSGMLALIDAGPEKLGALTEELENADGAAQSMAETMMNNLSGAVEDFSGTVETLGLAIYDEIKEPLTSIVKEADGYAEKLLNAFNENGFEGLVSEIGSVLSDVILEISEFTPQIIDAAVSIIDSFAEGLISNASSISVAAVDIGVSLLEGILSISTSVIELGAELIINLANGIADAFPDVLSVVSTGVLDVIGTIADAAPEAIKAATNLITSMVTGLEETLPSFIETGVALIETLIQGIFEALPTLIAALPTITNSIITTLTQALPALLEGITSIVMSIAEALPSLVVSILDVLPTIVQSIVDGITELLPMIIECGVTLLTSLVQELPTIINTIVLALPSIINSIVAALLEMVPLIVDCGVQLLVSLVQALPDIIYAIVNVLPVIIAAIISTLVGLIPLIIECGIDLLVSLVSALPQIITAIIAVMPSIIAAIISALLDCIPLLIQCGIDLLTSLIAALPDIIVALCMAAPKIIASIISALLSNIPLIVSAGIQLLGSLIKALPQIIATIVRAIPQIVTSIVNAFLGMKNKMVEAGKNLLLGLRDGISNAISSVISSAKSACQRVINSVKSMFGIHSPSKLFKDVIGRNLMLGMSVGIDAESGSVEDSMADIAKKVKDTDFSVDVPEFDDFDIDKAYRTLEAGVEMQANDIVAVKSASTSQPISKGGSDGDNNSSDNENIKYIENHIHINGRETAKVLTPYISKQLDWEGK